MSPEQEIKLVIPSDQVMDYFCYAHCKALLGKLKTLVKEDRVFVGGEVEARKSSNMNTTTTAIAQAVLSALHEQINFSGGDNPPDVDRLIKTTEEFLAIFEAKQMPAGANSSAGA